MEDSPSIIRYKQPVPAEVLSPLTLSLPPLRGVRKVTSRFRKLSVVTRGQAPRLAIVEDRSSSEHHNHPDKRYVRNGRAMLTRAAFSTTAGSVKCSFKAPSTMEFSR